MRRTIRVAGGVLIAALLLVAVLLILAVDAVDYRPALREPYHRETLTRLTATMATNTLSTGQLWAGFGRAVLTPTLNATNESPAEGRFRLVPLAGYGDRRGRPATGVHDDLYVKAVALRVGGRLGVMIGADALIIPEEVTRLAMQRCANELHLAREQLYLSATHTHASIGGWGQGPVAKAFAGQFQPGICAWFADRIVVAAREAIGDLKPASFGAGNFAAPEFIRNRLVGELGRVDPEFSFLVVEQQGGRKAILGSYAAHSTVLSGNVMEFSGDYPGVWQRAVEEGTGGFAMFLAGGMGSHSPVPGERGFAGTEKMGQALAASVLNRLGGVVLTNHTTFGIVGVEVTLPPPNWRVTDGVRLRPWLARSLLRAPDSTYLQVFRIGDSFWASTPCDFSGEMALLVKDTLRARGKDAVVTSFNGGYVGYVIPPRYYHLGGYEPQIMSFFGPNVPDYFDELIRKMAFSLL